MISTRNIEGSVDDRTIRVDVNFDDGLGPISSGPSVTVNWPALGDVSPEGAEQFAFLLARAAAEARMLRKEQGMKS